MLIFCRASHSPACSLPPSSILTAARRAKSDSGKTLAHPAPVNAESRCRMLLRFAAPMPVSDATSAKPSLAILAAIRFIRAHPLRVLLLSPLVLIPCFWHRRIEAGDLGSHLYNAWLAQLIAKGQAPGLYVVRQWNNVLADLSLLHLG